VVFRKGPAVPNVYADCVLECVLVVKRDMNSCLHFWVRELLADEASFGPFNDDVFWIRSFFSSPVASIQ